MLSYIRVILSYVELRWVTYDLCWVIYAFVLCSMRTSFPPLLGVILGKSLIKAFCERTSGRLQAKAAGFAHLAAVTIRHVPPFSPGFFCRVLRCGCAAGQRSWLRPSHTSFASCSWISRYALPSCGLITPHFLLILPTPLENKCLVTPSKLQPEGMGWQCAGSWVSASVVLHPTSLLLPHLASISIIAPRHLKSPTWFPTNKA